MWICKHCNKIFENLSPSEKANHSRWCDKNPKREKYLKILEKNRNKKVTKKNKKIMPLGPRAPQPKVVAFIVNLWNKIFKKKEEKKDKK
jgi:hypothetical protein